MSDLLNIQNLEITFQSNNKNLKTVKNFSINLNEKESLGIVGESGSGKTLSMLALTRLLPKQASVSSGSIIFQNRNLDELDNKNFYKEISGKKISMIFQEPMTALNPVHTIGKQLLETYLYHNNVSVEKGIERALEILDAVKLPKYKLRMDQYPHQLSGGQRQRVMIALALINNPSLLIADEPTTALDVTVQKEIIQLISDLRETIGMALIFISHDLGVVSQISDNVVVMKNGEIVEKGKTLKVLEKPNHPYTQGLLDCLFKLEDEQKKNQIKDTPIIKVKEISKSYKLPAKIFKKPEIIYAVKKVSFDVKFGETIAIVGESGSGKSTVAKIINGLINKDEGKVEIKGQNIEDIEISDRAKIIQPVFQDPYSTLNPIHTIGYIVSRPLIINENKSECEVKEEVIKILRLVGLSEEYYNRFPNQLSGGQRQRVAIARAIILKPQILICDEPTSALDVTIQSQILDLLNDLKTKLNITIILISHDISVVKYFSDRIIVMYNGEIIEMGNTNNVINIPKDKYTKRLMSSVFSLKKNEIKFT